jgi:hypothetical protein
VMVVFPGMLAESSCGRAIDRQPHLAQDVSGEA